MLPKSAFAGSNKNKLGPAAHLKGKMKRPARQGDLVGDAQEDLNHPLDQPATQTKPVVKPDAQPRPGEPPVVAPTPVDRFGIDKHAGKTFFEPKIKQGQVQERKLVPISEHYQRTMDKLITKILENELRRS